ncbi:MAG TPA: ABC transporter substrate-binding protein, partial [Candidatus Limnocylindrales bacterium]|nr:ABC transporter substrate-binding protein [Candidatus Limnocylindrales bacterium]
PAPPEPEFPYIEIAVTGPMTSIQGEMMWWGATMARDEINEAGGVMVGDVVHMIQLHQVDTNEILDPIGAVSAVEHVLVTEDPHFLVGGFRTEAVMAYTDLVARDYKKIFLICGAATNALLHGRVDVDYETWKYLFRVTPIKATDLVTVTILLLNDVATAVRAELGIAAPKVAVLAEALEWNEALVQAAPALFARLGLEHVGTWRPSATATDVTAELRAIEASGAHIIYTILSGPVGIPFGRQWGELEIPAAVVGINVEAQKAGYLEATGGFGGYDATLNTFARIPMTEYTIPFYDKFLELFGQIPTYNADTYSAVYILKEAVERAGTLDTDAVIEEVAKTDRIGPAGRLAFDAAHDITWGPGYVTAVGVQWQDGELAAFWPREWRPDPAKPDVVFGYEGTVPYQLPPHVLEQWRR